MSEAPVLQLLRSFAELVDARPALPISSHRKFPVGPALVNFKRAYRAVFQPLINETLRRQTALNERALALFQRLFLDVRSAESANLAFRGEVEERIKTLEAEVARLRSELARSHPASEPKAAVNGKKSHTTYR